MGKLLNAGVIGAGTISSSHARDFLKDGRAKIDAVCDILEKHARMKAERWGAKKVYSDYRDLLKDKDIDVVNLTATQNLHAEIGIGALEAGKHLLTEKPMALTLKDCDNMIAAAKRNSAKLMVGHNQLYYPHTKWQSNSLKKRLVARANLDAPPREYVRSIAGYI